MARGARRYPIDQCNYIRYNGAHRSWQARKGVNGWWHGYTEAEICERCEGANAGKVDTAMTIATAVYVSPTDGFVVTSNKKLKNEFGLAIATNGGGQLRLCSAHAAYNVARNVRPELRSDRHASQARFETLLPGGLLPVDDPSVDDVKSVLLDHFGISTTQLYNISPRVLVNFRDSVLLVRLELTYKGQAEPGFHLTVYHAASGAILDPDASDTKSVVVTDDDRVHQPTGRKGKADANEKAMRAFHAAFPVPSAIQVAEVYRCDRACA